MAALTNCTRCELCGAAASIYETGSFVHLSLLFRLVVEPLSILSLSLMTLAIYKTHVLHFNARVLLLCMTSSMLLCNIGVLVDSIYNLYISFVLPEDSRCEWQVFKPQYCLGLHNIYITGGTGLAISTVFLSIERSLATILYKTYEKVHRKWFGILLAVVQILCCIITLVNIVSPQQQYPYCIPDFSDTEMSKAVGLLFLVLNILNLFMFSILWTVNYYRSQMLLASQYHALSTRYQLKENISTTSLMIPVMIIVLAMNLSAQIVTRLHMPAYDKNTVVTPLVLSQVVHYAPYGEYQISIMPILSLLMVILLPCFSISIKRTFFRISRLDNFFVDNSSVLDTATVAEARELYFRKLRGQWQEPQTK